MSAIAIGNDLIHYEVLGRGRPVILLHGWLGSWRYWLPTMQLISAKYRVYALDLYGFGESQHTPGRYSVANQARLVEQFMDKQGIAKAALVGHSLGAAVAVELARRRPEIAPRVALISLPLLGIKPDDLPLPTAAAPRAVQTAPSTTHMDETIPHNPFRAADPARRAQLQAAALAAGSAFQPANFPLVPAGTRAVQSPMSAMSDLIGEATLSSLLERALPKRDQAFAPLQAEVDKTDKAAVEESMRSFAVLNYAINLCQLPMPVLLMHGRDDGLLPPPSDEVLGRVTAAKATGSFIPIVAPQFRHFPMIDNVNKFSRLLVDFLDADLTNSQVNFQLKETWSRQLR